MRKYRNKPVEIDGIRFASIKEGKRYRELKLLEKAGEIMSLLPHPVYQIAVNGVKICRWTADFCYCDKNGERVVEDCKGVRTQVYQLKKKLMLAVHGITIKEV